MHLQTKTSQSQETKADLSVKLMSEALKENKAKRNMYFLISACYISHHREELVIIKKQRIRLYLCIAIRKVSRYYGSRSRNRAFK